VEPRLPFEERAPGFWRRVGLTLKLALRTPMDAYGALPRGRSLGAPWRLKLLLAAPLYLCAVAGLGLAHLLLLAVAWARPNPLPSEARLALPTLLLGLLVLGPLLQFAAMIVGGAVLHGLLWAFRGTRNSAGLRQTLRATGYTQAVGGLLALAPLLGVAAYPAGKAVLGLGLARLHRTDPWRGLAAALTQALLTVLAALALASALVFWMARLDQKARQISVPAPEMAPLPPPHRPDLI
jgi:hypothetical protein